MLGDGLQVDYGSARHQGMTLDDLEKFVQGARMAGANGDEVVKVEASFRRSIRRLTVQFSRIPTVFEERAASMGDMPRQRGPRQGEGHVDS